MYSTYQRFWKEYNLQLNNELCNELNSFAPHQFSFLPKRSALQQLILFTERLLDGKNNTNEVDVIYMDFKKAFDSVSHNALLSKLQALGISGKLWTWLETYLKTCV